MQVSGPGRMATTFVGHGAELGRDGRGRPRIDGAQGRTPEGPRYGLRTSLAAIGSHGYSGFEASLVGRQHHVQWSQFNRLPGPAQGCALA